jgi:glutamate N-acetyltransferase / amino-acid N-acetyltransferase
MRIIKGGICASKNVKAWGVCKNNNGIAIISCKDSVVSGVFTSNKVLAAPIILTKEAIADGKISAIVINSGNANCFTGSKGLLDAKEMAENVAKNLDIKFEDVAVASTGVIGRKLPMPLINKLIKDTSKNLKNSSKASVNAAKAIMTTDTFYKELSVETKLKNGKIVKLGGIAKGSGMISPEMNTMLCFITTDVKASPQQLKAALKKAVDISFNMVVIDGDESTNDMALIVTDGSSGAIDENFHEALEYLCTELAKMIAKDGEGATKFMEVFVKGALSYEDAKSVAKSIVRSSLVKTSLFGADPNWGRIVAAVGYSGAKIDPNKISISIKSKGKTVNIVNKGIVLINESSNLLNKAEEIMKNKEISIIVDLGIDNYSATAYGCDLSYDYVKINAEYTT